MSLRINDKLELTIGQTCTTSNLTLEGQEIPYVSKVELVTDCQDKDGLTKLIVTIPCIKIENMEEKE